MLTNVKSRTMRGEEKALISMMDETLKTRAMTQLIAIVGESTHLAWVQPVPSAVNSEPSEYYLGGTYVQIIE